jgi:hypothetical protein
MAAAPVAETEKTLEKKPLLKDKIESTYAWDYILFIKGKKVMPLGEPLE